MQMVLLLGGRLWRNESVGALAGGGERTGRQAHVTGTATGLRRGRCSVEENLELDNSRLKEPADRFTND